MEQPHQKGAGQCLAACTYLEECLISSLPSAYAVTCIVIEFKLDIYQYAFYEKP